MEKGRACFYYIIAVISVVVICFVVLEFGIAPYYYSDSDRKVTKEFDPLLGWRLKPGSYSVKPSHMFKKHTVGVNAYGLRNDSINLPSLDLRKTILVLGDSFVCAGAVGTEKIFTTQLGEILNRTSPEEYMVINAGVPGYGAAQELLFMRQLSALGVVADVYILMVFTNDILDNLRLSYGSCLENH